jgi:hypothetical protein
MLSLVGVMARVVVWGGRWGWCCFDLGSLAGDVNNAEEETIYRRMVGHGV